MSDDWSFATKQIHSGQSPDPATGSISLPIFQTTAYQFRDTAHAADLFALRDPGHSYTRISNPTQQAVEERMAALEGGVAALLVGSGMAATALAIMNVAEMGDHVVASRNIYGGIHNLLSFTLPRFGVTTTFVDDAHDLDAWKKAVRPNTKAFFGEGLSNPLGVCLDIEGIAEVAHSFDVPWIVDNTIATPYVTRPFDYGADVVTHAASKYLSGHGSVIAGLIVDSGHFDFAKRPTKFPGFNTPDPSYNDIVYAQQFGVGSPSGNIAYILKARAQLLRDLGPAISPFNAWLIAQGLETLSMRMRVHLENAQHIAEWLAGHEQVAGVAYSGLPSSIWHDNQQRYASKGGGAVMSFEIRGGMEAGRAFVEGLRMFRHVANIGDVRSLVIHPASTTHAQLGAEGRQRAGITDGMIRLSIGIEDFEDIKADMELGFAAARA
ncbi:MAG: O-acetylhomoserine aminocarboxypropyltransferase/cysteine synthase family protein [Candidatus Nanopelagicales bacterium]